jgi:hypothetical protein
MADEQEILEAVDRIVDEIEQPLIREAEALGIEEKVLADRVANELKARDL